MREGDVWRIKTDRNYADRSTLMQCVLKQHKYEAVFVCSSIAPHWRSNLIFWLTFLVVKVAFIKFFFLFSLIFLWTYPSITKHLVCYKMIRKSYYHCFIYTGKCTKHTNQIKWLPMTVFKWDFSVKLILILDWTHKKVRRVIACFWMEWKIWQKQ